MALNYEVVERANPLIPDKSKRFYAQAKSSGEISIKKLSKEVAQQAGLNNPEVLAVINGLSKTLIRHLADGKVIRFGSFGAFQITLNGSGAVSGEQFDKSLIKGSKVTFRPGVEMKQVLDKMQYTEVEKKRTHNK